MFRLKLRIVAAGLALAATTVFAAEGMWPLDRLPLNHYEQAYGFKPDANWVRHVQRASARIAGGCSASFVSPGGLVMTNHHCVRACVQALTTASNDLIRDGFYAKEQKDERACAAMEIDRLDRITDVTPRMRRATNGLDGEAFAKAQMAEQARIEAECVGREGAAVRCDVVKLYQGGLYSLYKYRRYQDVRLVFAPEESVAPPCGTDLIDFPCHSLDVSLLRVYEAGKPARVRDWFRVSRGGIRAGDAAFVSGHPGNTERSRTLSQLVRRRDADVIPYLLIQNERRGMLDRFGAESADHARVSADDRATARHAAMGYRAHLQALQSAELLSAKRRREDDMRAWVDADPERKARYGKAWDEIARAQETYRLTAMRDAMIAYGLAFNTLFAEYAGPLVLGTGERAKPDGQRLAGYHESELPGIEQALRAARPADAVLETAKLALSLRQMQEWLGTADPIVVKVLGGETPDALAARLVKGTRLSDPAVRTALWQGGQKAIDASDDPFIVLFRTLAPDIRRMLDDGQNQLVAVQDNNGALIAQAHFERYGAALYPDATFSLRLSDGSVDGVDGGPALADLGGAYANAGAPGAMAFPENWRKAKERMNPSIPLNFVMTNDIVGGNSGSPVLDRNGELVGVVFAANRAADQGTYWYDENRFRAIAVDARGLLEVLDKVYDARRVVEEIRGKRE